MMDPISDFFIRIKNAQASGHAEVLIPYSQFKHEIARALERAGLVGKADRKGKRTKMLEIPLLVKDGAPLVRDVRLLSKPSRRLYLPYRRLGSMRNLGVTILSTPKGVMSGTEAQKRKVGGLLIAHIESTQ